MGRHGDFHFRWMGPVTFPSQVDTVRNRGSGGRAQDRMQRAGSRAARRIACSAQVQGDAAQGDTQGAHIRGHGKAHGQLQLAQASLLLQRKQVEKQRQLRGGRGCCWCGGAVMRCAPSIEGRP